MARPRSLTREQIAAAALSVVDRDGLAALSMRTVAEELGVGTMSLYRYVSDRADLEAWVVDHVLGSVDLELGSRARADWTASVTLLTERARAAIAGHPAVVPLLLTRRHLAPSSWRWAEAVLSVLAGAGFEGKDRALAFRALLAYLLGAAQVEHLGSLGGEGTLALSQLSPDEFPILSETARVARHITPDEEFTRGLSAVILGLEAACARGSRRAEPRRAGSRPRKSPKR